MFFQAFRFKMISLIAQADRDTSFIYRGCFLFRLMNRYIYTTGLGIQSSPTNAIISYRTWNSAKLWVQMVCNHSVITCNCLSLPTTTLKFLFQRSQMALFSPKLMASSQWSCSWNLLNHLVSLISLSVKPFTVLSFLIFGYWAPFNFTIYL